MENIIEVILNYGLAGVVCGYFMLLNYKFNEKLVDTLARIDERLESFEKREVNENDTNDKSKRR